MSYWPDKEIINFFMKKCYFCQSDIIISRSIKNMCEIWVCDRHPMKIYHYHNKLGNQEIYLYWIEFYINNFSICCDLIKNNMLILLKPNGMFKKVIMELSPIPKFTPENIINRIKIWQMLC